MGITGHPHLREDHDPLRELVPITATTLVDVVEFHIAIQVAVAVAVEVAVL
jgi:hypothetical protein